MIKQLGCIVAAGVFALSGFAAVADVLPADVKITNKRVAESLTGKPGDPVAGRRWFLGRKLGNCLACHKNKDVSAYPFHGEVGTPLDGVAGRHDDAQLRAILVNSKIVFGKETMMPAFYKNAGFTRVHKKFEGKTILSAQQIEDIIAYLKTLKN